MEAKQTCKEAEAGLGPDDGVQTNQTLQGDKELWSCDQVEGGQAEGEGGGETLKLRWEGIVEQGEGQGGEAERGGHHEEGEGEEGEEGGGGTGVGGEAVDGECKYGKGSTAGHRGEDVEGLPREISAAGCNHDDTANDLDESNNDGWEMLARVAASHLEQLDGKEVDGELSGEDHDKDKDADGGKGVHVFPVDRLHSFNQIRSWLLVLYLFRSSFVI